MERIGSNAKVIGNFKSVSTWPLLRSDWYEAEAVSNLRLPFLS